MTNLGPWLAATVDHLRNRWQAHVPPALVFVVATMALGLVMAGVFMVLGVAMAVLAEATGDDTVMLVAMAVLVVCVFAAILAGTLFIHPLYISYIRYTIRLLRGEAPKPGDLTWGYRNVVPVMGLLALTMVASLTAALFCYFPAFLVATALYFAFPVMADRECGPIEAVKESWALVKPRFLEVFLLMLVVFVCSMVLSYVPFVGPMAMIVVLVVLQSVAYVSLVDGRKEA